MRVVRVPFPMFDEQEGQRHYHCNPPIRNADQPWPQSDLWHA